MTRCSKQQQCGTTSGCSSCPSRTSDSGNSAVPLPPKSRGAKHTLFVMSGKGGVGKSAVTVNLAVSLANAGYAVGILDVDMHGPSVPSLLGLKARLVAKNESILTPDYYKGRIAVVSMDSLLEDRNTAIIWRGPKKAAAIHQFLSGVAWENLDYLLIDSPPGTGDEHLAVLKAIPDAHCIVVTTPQEISLADVRKALHFLSRVNARVLGIVENMSGLSCPHCGGDIDLFSFGGGEKLAAERDIPFLGRISIDPAMLAAANRQTPIADTPGTFPAKKAFQDIARKILERLPV